MEQHAKINPETHYMTEQRFFEDFRLGERFVLPSRTMTDALFAAFSLASGDNHPVHYDVEYCRSRGMPGMLAHGFQVAIQTAAGAGLFPHMVEHSLMGFIEQSSRFVKPVFTGDTLYSVLEVSELKEQRTTGVLTMASTVANQRGETVLEGMQRYLLRKRDTNRD
jgi:acyl dehydratase